MILIDGRNFYEQPINDLIKQYQQGMAMAMIVKLVVYWIMHILKTITGQEQFIKQYFKELLEEKITKIRLYTILEKSKETVVEFAKGTAKVL